jgi:hypothetical protein
MKALLHCGTFKTGSTAIQNTAWYNRDALQRNGVIYPKSGIDTRAGKEDGEIGYRHSRFVYEYGKETYRSVLASLDHETKGAKDQTLFLSAEPWSNPQAAVTLNAAVEHLRGRGFKEIQGLVFVRNARDYMVRHYREWVRRYGVSLDFPSYILSRKHFFDYLTICKKFQTIFGGNIEFVNYDTVHDASQFTFEKLGLPYESLEQPAQTNQGLPCVDIEIRRILNQYGLRIRNIPDSETLLGSFGLSTRDTAFTEKLPSGFLDIYNKQYVRDFSAVTGIDRAESKALFSERQLNYIDVGTTSVILEAAVFEWLKRNQRQAG